jgi:formylglycine-generating enzyme required for sulfatase activity
MASGGGGSPVHSYRRFARLAVVALLAVTSAWPSASRAAEEAGTRPAFKWIDHPDRKFAILATEVTVAQFRACLESGACKAETADAACNLGSADAADYPANCVSYYGAEQVCAYAGGRVCTEDEWLAACRGTEVRAFPYGNAYDPGACNAYSATAGATDVSLPATLPVGSMAGCQGGLPGLFDMAGNVAEWVDACKGSYCRFRGAGYRSNDPVEHFAGCSGVCSGNDKGLRSNVVGVRCCRDR